MPNWKDVRVLLPVIGAAMLFLALGACSSSSDQLDPCPDCEEGTGAASFAIPIESLDVMRVVAVISGDGIVDPIVQQLQLDGDPLTAHGLVTDIPAGAEREIALLAYPALEPDYEFDLVIYSGMALADILPAQTTTVDIVLNPVYGDVHLTANFEAGDSAFAAVDKIEATISGNRIASPRRFFLSKERAAQSAVGELKGIPVGLARTFLVRSFDSDKVLLHEGTVTAPVTEGTNEVVVEMSTASGGAADINGEFCEPDCNTKKCGDDGCGGSCGACWPGAVCTQGDKCIEVRCPPEQPIELPNGDCVATLGQAIDATNDLDHPEFLLNPGEYTLDRAISRGMTFKALSSGDAEWPSAYLMECIAPIKPPAAPVKPDVKIRPADGLNVAMTDSNDRMVLAGVELIASAGKKALAITKGHAVVFLGVVVGPITVKSDQASLVLADTMLVNPDAEPAALPFRLEDETDMYTAEGMCEAALLVVDDGALFNGINMELTDHSVLGVCVRKATAYLCGGSIHHIEMDDDYKFGRGAYVTDAGRLTLKAMEVYHNREAGVLAEGLGTEASLIDGTSLVDMQRGTVMNFGVGAIAQAGAQLTIDNASISNTEGPGVFLIGGASADLDTATLRGNAAAAVVVFNASLSMTQSRLSDTVGDANEGLGFGLYVDHAKYGAATVEVTGSSFAGNLYGGIYVYGDGGSVSLIGNSISHHEAAQITDHVSMFGYGLLAEDVCSGLIVSANSWEENEGSHLFLHGSNLTLPGGTFLANGQGLADFIQQDCVGCVTPFELADLALAGLSDPPHIIEICPYYNYIVPPINLSLYFEEAVIEP